jgi:hypothetical protein
VSDGCKDTLSGIVFGESSSGSQPYHTRFIFKHQFNPFVGQQIVIISGGAEHSDILTVIFIEAIFGPEPHESFGILINIVNRTK